MDASRLASLVPALQKFVDEGEIPHGELVVARYGKICYRERVGYLDVASKQSLPDDALFRKFRALEAAAAVDVWSAAQLTGTGMTAVE